MKPLAKIIFALFLTLAGVCEWLIIQYRVPIRDFMYNNAYVSIVQWGLIIGGALVVVAAGALVVARRVMRIKREYDFVPDTSALCGFAIAMLLIIVLCWTLMCSVGCDATLFEGGALSFLALFGSVVSIRVDRKSWIVVYILMLLLAGATFPASGIRPHSIQNSR